MSTTRALKTGLPLAIVSLALGGCAGMQQDKLSVSQQSELLAEKDAEIERLSSEISAMERQRLLAAGASEQDLKAGTELLPPDARPGQCFARVFVPPQYEIETLRVLKSDASKRIETTPAKYAWAEERVLVKEASEQLEVVPATYEWVEERIISKPASSKIVSVPAKYKTVTERVLDKPEHTVWKKGTGPITRIDEGTGEIMCLVTVPATYKTISKKVLVEQASTREVEIPAEYKTVKKRVMKTPPTTRKITIPAEYKTVKVRKLVAPASSRSVEIPASYETVKRSNMVTDGRVEWRPVLCKTNMTSDVARSIQIALDKAGFNPGPIDGIIGAQTMSAVKRYQQKNGLATGGLTIKTLESLKVNL